MATTTILTYEVEEVCQMLGMNRDTAMAQIKKGKFPFKVIQLGRNKYVVPRADVDRILKGTTGGDRTEQTATHHGKPKRWHKGEFKTWNFKLPLELAEAFKIVVDAMNRDMAVPISYNDAKILAIQEFIERRPLVEAED